MDDLISRQAAIDEIRKCRFVVDAIEKIRGLPPAEPKTGKWKFTKFYTWECSQCKKNPTKGFGYVQGKDELFDFCPNCGADMRGEEE